MRARAAWLCVLSIGVAVPQAGATTIGQLAPGSAPPALCMVTFDVVNPAVTSGAGYVVPSYGTALTSWSTNAAAAPNQTLTLKVFRPVSGLTYRVVAHDGPRPLASGSVNTFPVNIGVLPGDLIGLNSANAPSASNACVFSDPGFSSPTDRYRSKTGDAPDGADVTFGGGSVAHTNLTAVV